jgi:hypothetical protein
MRVTEEPDATGASAVKVLYREREVGVWPTTLGMHAVVPRIRSRGGVRAIDLKGDEG